MFTWICPKCGTEVPPSYNDCPNCAAREKAAAAPAPVPTPAPIPAPTPVYAPPPVAPAPVVPAATQAYVQPPLMGTVPQEAPPPSFSYGGGSSVPASSYDAPLPPPAGGLPSWLIAVLSILGVAAVGYGVFHFMRDKGSVAPGAAMEEAASQPAGNSPLAKYVEVVGFRIVESKQQVQLKFIIVNHSAGELAPFDLNLQVRTKTAKADEPALFTIKTPVSGVLPFEAKDMTIPVKTALRAYEIPDWQFLTATFDIAQP